MPYSVGHRLAIIPAYYSAGGDINTKSGGSVDLPTTLCLEKMLGFVNKQDRVVGKLLLPYFVKGCFLNEC